MTDNVAMLGLALHLWTMGYYVDKDGNVIDLFSPCAPQGKREIRVPWVNVQIGQPVK